MWKTWKALASAWGAKDGDNWQEFKARFPNPATVRDPSFRQTILCTALAHTRGKIHATYMRGHEHAPSVLRGEFRVTCLQDQAKLLRHYVGNVKRYAEYWGRMYGRDPEFAGRAKQAELTHLELKIIEAIIALPIDVVRAA